MWSAHPLPGELLYPRGREASIIGRARHDDYLVDAECGQLIPVFWSAVPGRHRYLDAVRITPALLAASMKFGHVVGNLREAEIEAIPAVTKGCDSAECGSAVAADEDRHAPISDGAGVHANGIEVSKRAVERRDIVPPERLDRRHVLFGPSSAPLEGDTQGSELLCRPTDAYPENEASSAQSVERGCLLGYEYRTVLGKKQDAGPQTDPTGYRGDKAQGHQGVEPVGMGGNG